MGKLAALEEGGGRETGKTVPVSGRWREEGVQGREGL